MLAISMNPNAITLSPVNGTFDSNLPARLAGLIDPQEYAASIQRCNIAFQSGSLWLANSLLFLGPVCWGILFGLAWATSDFGPNPIYMFGAFGALVFFIIVGRVWRQAIVRQRIDSLRAAVSAEHAYYNSAARAQARGLPPNARLPPISWNVLTQNLVSYGYRRTYFTVFCQIQIEVGQGVMPVVMMQQQPVQPLPAYQGQNPYPQYGAVAAPPAYAPQNNGGYPAPQNNGGYPAPQAQQQAYPPQAYPAQQGPQAPLLTNDYQSGEGSVQVTCSGCGRVSNSNSERFCSGCGKNLSR